MSVSGWALPGIMVVVAGVAVAWPAHADPDMGLAEAEGLVLQNDSWVAGVGEHSRW
jgi:hypothetical protein